MRSLIICTTCRFSGESKTDTNGRSGGELLLAHVQEVLSEAQRTDIVIEEQACLWNCQRHCSVIMRDEERFSYVTGDHVPERAQAEAIIQWFDAHGASEKGEVPFRQWPDAMRGHFIARVPPVQS